MAVRKSGRKKTARKKPATKRSTAKAAGKPAARQGSARKSASRKSASKKSASKKSVRVPSRSSAVKGSSTTGKSTSPKRRASSDGITALAHRHLAEYRRKRDFTKTAEPSGEKPVAPQKKALRFVIQKHAASHLHFDWRLELDGVMKSWAVPKGPSVVPGEKRLAMEVEDHPISYNTFEGTIPKGQYGGGTVMLWDRGTYEAGDGGGPESVRRGYEKGTLDITMHGERLQGKFTMIRTRSESARAQWLLIKRTDEFADDARDIVDEIETSVDSGRTMEQISAGKRVWQSNRG